MKISEKYTTYSWNYLELSDPADWQEAINIRFESRYFKFIKLLQPKLYSGFIVLAIDCMVIETLAQFYLGTHDLRGVSRKRFIDFLYKGSSFKNYFDEHTAELFYDHVRNGIVHQTETKSDTLIRIDQPFMVQKICDWQRTYY